MPPCPACVAGALHRHRRRGDERHRAHPAGARGDGVRVATPRTRARCSRCGRSAPRSRSVTTPHNLDLLAGGPTAVVSSTATGRPDNPELLEAAARGILACSTAPRRSPRSWPATAPRACRARRQDVDHLDAHRRAAGLRHRPVVHDRRRPAVVGRRARTTAWATSSSPRPTRATARSSPTRRPSRSSPTSSPTTSTTTAPSRPTSRCSTPSPTRIEPGGVLVVCADDPGAAALGVRAEEAGVRVRRYGRTATGPEDAHVLDYRAEGALGVLRLAVAAGGDRAAPRRPRRAQGPQRLRRPARGPRPRRSAGRGCSTVSPRFDGVRRRFEFSGSADGVRVYDDYAHRPPRSRPSCAPPARCSAGPGG